MKKYKIKDKLDFSCYVFGADCFIEHFPKLLTEGMSLVKKGELYYIDDDGKTYDTCFFSQDELKFLKEVTDD